MDQPRPVENFYEVVKEVAVDSGGLIRDSPSFGSPAESLQV